MPDQQSNDATLDSTTPPAPNLQSQNIGQIKYAGFWIRWVAASIDGLITSVITLSLGIALIAIFKIVLGASEGVLVEIIVNLFGYLFVATYFIAMTYGRQATLGKGLANIMVISDKSENLTLWQVVLRETIGKIISALILGIGYIMAGFTQRKQSLHDKIAKTLVVYKDPNKKLSVWAIILALILPILMIVAIMGVILVVFLLESGYLRPWHS